MGVHDDIENTSTQQSSEFFLKNNKSVIITITETDVTCRNCGYNRQLVTVHSQLDKEEGISEYPNI